MSKWKQQCEEVKKLNPERGIRYLVGEKFILFLRDTDEPNWAQEVVRFAAEIKTIFSQADLQDFFERTTSHDLPPRFSKENPSQLNSEIVEAAQYQIGLDKAKEWLLIG